MKLIQPGVSALKTHYVRGRYLHRLNSPIEIRTFAALVPQVFFLLFFFSCCPAVEISHLHYLQEESNWYKVRSLNMNTVETDVQALEH